MEDGDSKPIVIPGIPENPPQTEEVAGKLTQMLSENGIGNEVSVQTNIEGIMISLSEKLVFSPGSDQLAAEVYPLLDTIAGMVIPIENNIRLVGHTDDTPPLDAKYENSFELSMARAMVVAEYLMSKGVSPKRLIISGKGQYDPIFPNDSEAHRSLNGRVDIVVVYQVENFVIGSDVIQMDPNIQYGLDTTTTNDEKPASTEPGTKEEGGD
jgi:chemotaxis protein MotB